MILYVIQYIDRSGSTFLANLLAKQHDILVFPELGALAGRLLSKPGQQFNKQLATRKTKNPQIAKWPLEAVYSSQKGITNIEVLLLLFTEYVKKHSQYQSSWVFKMQYMPAGFKNFSQLGIKNLQVKFISLVRDPRAVFNSSLAASKAHSHWPFNRNPIITSIKWKLFIHDLEANKKMVNHLIIRFEDLFGDYFEAMKNIESFFHTKFDHSNESGNEISFLSKAEKLIHTRINQTPDSSRIDAWKEELSPVYIRLVQELTSKELVFYKYVYYPTNRYKIPAFFLKLYYKLRIIIRIDGY